MSVSARSTLDNARLHVAGVDDTGAFYREDDDLDAGSDSDVLGSDDDDVAGTIVYRTPTGSGTVSVSFLGEEFSIAGVARCQFAGTAVQGSSTLRSRRRPSTPPGRKPCTKRTKALISRALNTQGGDAVPGRLKLAITLALAGLIVGATPVLASTGSHGQTPMAGYTGKVQNRVLSDTSAGGNSSFIDRAQAAGRFEQGVLDEGSGRPRLVRVPHPQADRRADAGPAQGHARPAGRLIPFVLGGE